MAERGVGDPLEVLPEILVLSEERAIAEARIAAQASVKEELQRLLQRLSDD